MLCKRLPSDLQRVFTALCEDIRTPFSLDLLKKVESGDWAGVLSLKTVPADYATSEAYYRDTVAAEFLRKCAGIDTGVDLREEAVKSFWSNESGCYEANERLSRYLFPPGEGDDAFVRKFFTDVKRLVSCILGPCPTTVIGRFGKGATYGDRGRLTTLPDKISSRPTLTWGAMGFLFPWTDTAWSRHNVASSLSRPIEFVSGNRFTTVPKDSEKDRGICIEPSINLFYQLGMGRVMRNRLRLTTGIDLNNAQDLHRAYAQKASRDGLKATLDLSNASDLISYNLVKLCVPHPWFQFLDSVRSPTTLIDGKCLRLEKFSSMGNGFTFELETILFLAIAVTASGGTIADLRECTTFGDDILCLTENAESVVAALRFCGLKINARKSFIKGPFRESCGGDYFNGDNVRAFNLKGIPHEPNDWIALANGLYHLGRPDHNGQFSHDFCRRAWLRAMEPIPSHIRCCRGPQILGDIVLHDAPEKWTTRVRSCIRYFKVWRPCKYETVPWNHFEGSAQLAARLYTIGTGTVSVRTRDTAFRDLGIIPRDSVIGYKVGWVAYS